MRALFGMFVCSAIAVVATFVWPRRDAKSIDGLWIGSLKIAKRLFKGAEPNDETFGAKVRAALAMTEEGGPAGEGAEPVVEMSQADAERMCAVDGDMIYLADRRWWLGGLVSLHARLAVADVPEGTARLDRHRAEEAGFGKGRGVVVEKIL
jgi:hypothetical protein